MKIRIRKQLAIALLILLVGGIALTLYALSNRQDIRQFAACPADSAVCSWDPVEGAISYHYKITSSEAIVEEGDIDAPADRINFTPVAGQTYTCEVFAINNCGASGPAGQATQTCTVSDSPTPIPPTPSPSDVPTVTPIVSDTPTPTQTNPVPSDSPTPIPNAAPTNTPTQPPQATNTPTSQPVPSDTPYPTTVVAPTSSPTPGIPPTGSETFNIGIALGTLIAIIGMAVFFTL